MNRRNVLFATTTAAVAATGLRSPMTASAAPLGAPLAPGDWSAVTYMAVPAQKQLAVNEGALQGKPYAGFFDPNLAVPTETARSLTRGRLNPSVTLTPSISDLRRLLDPAYQTPDNGYAVLEGPTAYVQSRIVMPGVTAEMFKWWFTWHPVESERYALWFPHAHIENSVADPARLQNTSLSYEERLYGNVNHVVELIGPRKTTLNIHFMDPVRLGFDADALRRAGFTASASGLVSPGPELDAVLSMMVHLARDTAGGLELVSRYWLGPHPEFRRFAGANNGAAIYGNMGFSEEVAEQTAYELSVHDLTEFNHLARILPGLHANFA